MDLGRRNVIKMTLALAGAAVLSKLPLSAEVQSSKKCIRIVPIPGTKYPESFLSFAARARFSNPRDAIASVRDRRLTYDLVWTE